MFKKIIVIILLLIFLSGEFFVVRAFEIAKKNNKYMTAVEYQNAIVKQNEIHNYIRTATNYEKKGQHDFALQYYLKAYEINECAGLRAVCRGAMADNYEALGEYDKALEHVDWFLKGLSPNEPLFKEMTETKQRLLQKIEAQKKYSFRKATSMPAVSVSQVSRNSNIISDFQEKDYATQKQFLEKELPEGTDILRLSKRAMLAEHAGNFKDAKGFYEQLLAQKEGVAAVYGEAAWVMLHPAVQRMSELTGDETREKEMLVWIRDYMLAPDGQHHKYLNGLMPPVQGHLKERLKKFGLNS